MSVAVAVITVRTDDFLFDNLINVSHQHLNHVERVARFWSNTFSGFIYYFYRNILAIFCCL